MPKPNIILDLDQTLISAEAVEEFEVEKYKNKQKKFNKHDMEGYYVIFERPKLQKFLDYIFENFNVSIWTAATKDYALFIIDKIILQNKPERKLQWIFFSYHCELSKSIKKNSKDLSLLWEDFELVGYDKNNTVIIDDYDEVYKTQKHNCIVAVPFEFTMEGSEKDTYLEKLIPLLAIMREKILNGKSKPAKDVNKDLLEYSTKL